MFRTLFATLRISLIEMTAYRSNLIIWSIIDAIPPLAVLFVWITVYHTQHTIGGLTESQMLAYYIGVLLVTATVSVHVEWDIQDNIRNGLLKMYLVKPLPFPLVMATEALAWRINASIVNVPVAIGLIWLLNQSLHLTAPYPFVWQFWLSLLGSLGIYMSMSFAIGNLMFFFQRINGIIHANGVLQALASGSLLPLSLFPAWAQQVVHYLPYRFQFDFPIRVLIGTVGGADFWIGILQQWAWVLLFSVIAIVLWQQGLRHYDAPEQVGVAGVEA